MIRHLTIRIGILKIFVKVGHSLVHFIFKFSIMVEDKKLYKWRKRLQSKYNVNAKKRSPRYKISSEISKF